MKRRDLTCISSIASATWANVSADSEKIRNFSVSEYFLTYFQMKKIHECVIRRKSEDIMITSLIMKFNLLEAEDPIRIFAKGD